MKIKKIVLNNFRQFKGTQEIIFSDNNSSGVTVIFGENGRGKTGIFRAMSFCLFGAIKLPQDDNVSETEITLVNLQVLDECIGTPVSAYVKVLFSHNACNYEMRRSINAIKTDDEITEENGELSLLVTKEDGNSEVIDKNIDEVINSILDKRLKDYFFLDGEKIEHLTRASAEQKREISIGIKNLLNINALEIAISSLSRITRHFEETAKDVSSEDLTRLYLQKKKAESEKDKIIQLTKEYYSSIDSTGAEIKKYDTLLRGFNDIKDLIEKRRSIEESLENEKNTLTNLSSKMHDRISSCSMLVILPDLIKVFESIDIKKKNGEIPSVIRKELIEKLLAEKKCICGNDLAEGSHSHTKILEWLNKTSKDNIDEVSLDLWRYLSDIINSSDDKKNLIEEDIFKYNNIKGTIKRLTDEAIKLSEKIGTSDRKDAGSFESQRSMCQQQLFDCERRLNENERRLKELDSEIDKYNSEIKVEEIKQGQNNEKIKASLLAKSSYNALNSIYNDFTNEVKELIANKATQILQSLLDTESAQTMKKIVVEDDYALQILDRYNKKFLANISAGQRQIMSISYIISLAQIASGTDKIFFPFFMDTPFGRLSSEHRSNLISFIPKFMDQWILLATDTEFTREEARLLQKTNKWKYFYQLITNSDGNTIIKSIPIDKADQVIKEGQY